MASEPGRPKGRERKQQSLSLSKDVIDQLEREAEITGIPKSQIVNKFLRQKMDEESKDKPTIITIMSFKGGVAKTTTSACLSICLGEDGYKVLIIDLDGQGSISQYLGVYDPRAEEPCIADVMLPDSSGKRLTLDDVIHETDYKNVSIVPSSFRFSDADSRMRTDSAAGVDSRLCYAIEDLQTDFDFIIIDCPPSLGLTVTNAITALEAGANSSCLIIPVRVDGFAIAGLSQTIDTIERVASERRTTPQRWKILRTMVEKNTSAYKVGMELITDSFKNANFTNTSISKSTIAPESTLAMTPLVAYAPDSKLALEYRLLAQEIETQLETE